MLKFCAFLVVLFVCAMCAVAIEDEARTMSLNSEVMVVPAPGPVVIDGNTDDWDLSAGVWSYNSPTIVDKYSVWTHMMWDAKGVYFLARFADRTPMANPVTGKDFANSWKNDCYQARVVFDDRKPDEHEMHINMFYSAPDACPYLIVTHGGFMNKPPYDATGPARPDQLARYGATMEAFGGKIAAKKWDDGKGYNLEAFWPWTYCRTSAQPLKPGEQFTFGIEGLWGGHRLADGIKDDTVNRIFMFRARDGWGRAVISATGHLDITARQQALQAARFKRFINYDTAGSIPIAYSLPEDRDVTIAIDNANGVRVRNLFGQYPRKAGALTDLWDGLDDKGKPVAPGAYTATVVDHKPISLRLYNSVYNAGTPPWITDDGNHCWGCNHGYPTGVVSRGAVKLATFVGCEGTPGILRVDDQDRVLWTAVDEVCNATLDDTTVYCLTRNYAYSQSAIQKYAVETGRAVLFTDAVKSPYMPLPVDIAAVKEESTIACYHNVLYALVLGPNKLFRIAPDTGAILATADSDDLVAVKDRNGILYGLYKNGTVATLKDDGTRDHVLFIAAGLQPLRLGISQDATRFAVTTRGTNQVVVYTAHGKAQQTIGHAFTGNDRPAGKFVETNLISPLGVDIDAQGNLWVAEAQGTCRRVTRWTPAGKLQHSFWGGADYGAMSGYAVTDDATRFICFGLEFQLDPQPDPLHKGTAEKPLIYHPDLTGRGYVYKIGKYEYAVSGPEGWEAGGLSIAKRDKDGVFRPCAWLHFATAKKPGEAWCDRNENGKVDPDEVTTNVKGGSVYWSCGWTRPDLTMMSADELVYPCLGFTKNGVPLYDFHQPTQPANRIPVDNGSSSRGTIIMDQAGNITDGITFATTDGRKGSYPNLYGRHDAPAAQRGVLIAVFRANGILEKVPAVGSVVAVGGDRGEWYFLTTDGLYLSSICQDAKGDVTLDDTFIGQESFGGFVWNDPQGRTFVQLGGPSFRIMQVLGLDTCRKTAIKLTITQAQIDEGARIAAGQRTSAPVEPAMLTIARVAKLPDAPPAAGLAASQPLLAGVPEMRVVAAGNPARWWRAVFLHDGTNLGILWQVADDSPWKNGEGRYTHAFIGGDAVDLKLDVPGRGPIRLLAAPIVGKDVAVYWQQKATKQDNPITYLVNNNPGNGRPFDVVHLLPNATVKVSTEQTGYSVLLTVPLADLGLTPGGTLKGIAGVIFSNPAGTNRLVRLYWHDKETDLVSDVPSEAGLDTARWGTVTVQP